MRTIGTAEPIAWKIESKNENKIAWREESRAGEGQAAPEVWNINRKIEMVNLF